MNDFDKLIKLTNEEAREVIARLAEHKRKTPFGKRLRAWQRSLPPVVTASDVKEAWRMVKLARNGTAFGAGPELFEERVHDFEAKLAAWLNS